MAEDSIQSRAMPIFWAPCPEKRITGEVMGVGSKGVGGGCLAGF